MPRLREVSRAQADPDVATMYDMLFGERDPVAEPGTATGTPGNGWTVVALVPDVFRHCIAGFGLYRSAQRTLSPKLRELVLQGGRVQDATFAALRAHLSEEQILELTYITLTYQLHATMCRALRLEYDDVPERVVEVPAPDEAASRDIMADISRPGDD